MTTKARLENIASELAAIMAEGRGVFGDIPVGLVSMALRFVHSALTELDRNRGRRVVKTSRFTPQGGMDRSVPKGDR